MTNVAQVIDFILKGVENIVGKGKKKKNLVTSIFSIKQNISFFSTSGFLKQETTWQRFFYDYPSVQVWKIAAEEFLSKDYKFTLQNPIMTFYNLRKKAFGNNVRPTISPFPTMLSFLSKVNININSSPIYFVLSRCFQCVQPTKIFRLDMS